MQTRLEKIANQICIMKYGGFMYRDSKRCPMCDEETSNEEILRFGMCLDCFAETIIQNICESILYDFLREYRNDFKDYVYDNYGF